MDWFWIVAFLVGFVTDVLYVLWFWASQNHKAWTGGLVSAIMYGIGLFAVVAVVEERQYAAPLIAGYAAGSVVGIKWKAHNENRSDGPPTG